MRGGGEHEELLRPGMESGLHCIWILFASDRRPPLQYCREACFIRISHPPAVVWGTQTALMQACRYGHWEVAQTLLLYKANVRISFSAPRLFSPAVRVQNSARHQSISALTGPLFQGFCSALVSTTVSCAPRSALQSRQSDPCA